MIRNTCQPQEHLNPDALRKNEKTGVNPVSVSGINAVTPNLHLAEVTWPCSTMAVNICHQAANPKAINEGILRKHILLHQHAVKTKVVAGS